MNVGIPDDIPSVATTEGENSDSLLRGKKPAREQRLVSIVNVGQHEARPIGRAIG